MSQEYNRPSDKYEQKAGEAPKVLDPMDPMDPEAGNGRDKTTTGEEKESDRDAPTEPGDGKGPTVGDITPDDKHSAEAEGEREDDNDDDWKEVRICNIN